MSLLPGIFAPKDTKLGKALAYVAPPIAIGGESKPVVSVKTLQSVFIILLSFETYKGSFLQKS